MIGLLHSCTLFYPPPPPPPLQPTGYASVQARQTRQNSGGVAEGHPRFDKGGVAIIFYFLRVKNRTF